MNAFADLCQSERALESQLGHSTLVMKIQIDLSEIYYSFFVSFLKRLKHFETLQMRKLYRSRNKDSRCLTINEDTSTHNNSFAELALK